MVPFMALHRSPLALHTDCFGIRCREEADALNEPRSSPRRYRSCGTPLLDVKVRGAPRDGRKPVVRPAFALGLRLAGFFAVVFAVFLLVRFATVGMDFGALKRSKASFKMSRSSGWGRSTYLPSASSVRKPIKEDGKSESTALVQTSSGAMLTVFRHSRRGSAWLPLQPRSGRLSDAR